MASETFYIHVRAISGATIDLDCGTSTATGRLNDLATTRSFALIAIEDGMRWAGDTPLKQAMTATAGGERAPIWEETWHRDHVAEFIASTELLERSNIIDDEEKWWAGYESGSVPRHGFVLRATMTDPRFLEGLAVNKIWGTTAYDAWYPDPAGPTREQIAAVTAKASHWP